MVREQLRDTHARAEHNQREALRLGQQGRDMELRSIQRLTEAEHALAQATNLLKAKTEECENLKALAESQQAKTEGGEVKFRALAESAGREAVALREALDREARNAQEAAVRADAAEVEAKAAEEKLQGAMREVKQAVTRVAWCEGERHRLRACCEQNAHKLKEVKMVSLWEGQDFQCVQCNSIMCHCASRLKSECMTLMAKEDGCEKGRVGDCPGQLLFAVRRML
jgi:hypothetical protein